MVSFRIGSSRIFGVGSAEECYGLSIGRPGGLSHPFRQARKPKRLAACHIHHEKLRLVGLAILFGHAHEGEILAIRRPAWGGIACVVRQLMDVASRG